MILFYLGQVKLIIDLPNKKLSFKTMKINGNIQIKSGSAVIHTTTVTRWSDDASIWENNRIPQEGEDINVPQNTTIVVTNQSNITANYFKKLSVPESSKFIIDIPNYAFKAEKLDIKGTIQLNHGSTMKIIPPVFTYIVKVNINFIFTGRVNETLKQADTNTQRNIIVKTLANYHNVSLDRIKLKSFKVESITADYELLTDNSADTYLYTFQTC